MLGSETRKDFFRRALIEYLGIHGLDRSLDDFIVDALYNQEEIVKRICGCCLDIEGTVQHEFPTTETEEQLLERLKCQLDLRTPEYCIKSSVFSVDGVVECEVLPGPRENSIRIFVEGGEDREVATEIEESVGFGVEMIGDRVYRGVYWDIRFSRFVRRIGETYEELRKRLTETPIMEELK